MPKIKQEEPRLIEGATSVDDRGTVSFVNDFSFSGVKRSYIVTNHKSGFVRAWHAHKKEAKYVTVVRGSAIVGAVKIDDWKKPSKNTPVSRYTLSDKKPSVLYIPAGYANGFMSLTRDTIMVFYSTATLEQSRGDDTRFEARYWDIWQIIER
jgi:dTDP-4-dehydrorhamnose 3,5-epimerase-like enzyme